MEEQNNSSEEHGSITQDDGSAAGHYVAVYDRGYTNLVSVIPPGAPLAPNSGISGNNLGKVPGIRGRDGLWRGYGFINKPAPTREEVQQWERDGANLGMLGKYNPAIDVDCDDPEVVERIEAVALRVFGPMPTRYGRKPRLLLVGRTDWTLNKRVLNFSLKSKPDVEHKVEILCNGQQYLIAGRHPAGMMYTWKGKGLAEVPQDQLPKLTAPKVEEFFDAVQAEFGDDFVLGKRGKSGDSSKIPPQESLRGDLEEVRTIVAALPNQGDRDFYVTVGMAIRAALWDHPTEGFELFFDWAGRWTDGANTAEEIETRWRGFNPPFRIGVQWLRDQLRKHNPSAAEALIAAKFDAEARLSGPPAELVLQSGLTVLAAGTSMREVRVRLQQVVGGLEGVTGLERELVRSELVTELKRIGVASPGRVVDAALPRAMAPDDTKEDDLVKDEPWHEPVTTNAVLDDVRMMLRKYVVLPEPQALTVALWVLHSYAIEAADYTPYLWVSSPVRECGKSTLLDLLSHLAYRAQFTGGITAAALYRRIARLSPTMLLDELDTRLHGDGGEALRGVLNSGFHRSGRMTICVGEDHHEEDFATFSAKVLAGIGRLWDTVTSRSIPIRMERASREELKKVKRIRGDRIGDECAPVRRRLLRWKNDMAAHLREYEPLVPEALGARHADVWRPLLTIAETAGLAIAEQARQVAVLLHRGRDEEGDLALLLLSDVRDLLAASGTTAILTSAIVNTLGVREDRPWSEYRGKEPITPRGVAALLGRFGVKPTTVRAREERGKGYRKDDLAPLFQKYLAEGEEPGPSVTSVTNTPPVAPLVGIMRMPEGEEDPALLDKLLGMAPADRLVTDVTDAGGMNHDSIRAATHGLVEFMEVLE